MGRDTEALKKSVMARHISLRDECLNEALQFELLENALNDMRIALK